MQQRISFITLGVQDLIKMKDFYSHTFGWQPLKDDNGIVFYKLNSFIFSLFPAHELTEDIGINNDVQSGFRGFTFAYNVSSEKEVDELYAQLQQKGVTIIKAPQKVFWGGYHCYVTDIENNYWEIAYNPFLDMDSEGNVVTHG